MQIAFTALLAIIVAALLVHLRRI